MQIYYNSQNLEHQQHRMLVRIWSSRNSHALVGLENDTATLEESLMVLLQNEEILIIQSSSRVLGVHTKELKTYIHTKICRLMFKAASFIIART